MISVSRRCKSWQHEPALPPGELQIDALEDGGHLSRRDLDTIALGLREAEDTAFQSLGPDRQAVSIPIQDLQPVAPAIPEHEEMTGERILADVGPIRDSAAVMITWRETPRASSIMVSSFEAHF